MSNTAIDYERQDALEAARKQDFNLPSPGQFNVPNRGSADNYSSDNARYADNYAGSKNNHTDRLAEARERDEKSNTDKDEKKGGIKDFKNLANTAKNIAETATPMGAASLLKQINFIGDMPFVAALGAALAKDLFTLATFETVILPIIFSALCSIFIFMMLLLVGANGKRKGANALFKKIVFLIGGGILGSIPGLDIFPFETATVAVIYFLTLVERKNAQE